MQKKKIKAGEILLAYEEYGAGPPVVLLHGFAASSLFWKETIPFLGESYRWLLPDLRGHGQTEVPDGPYPMEMMAEDIAGFLDALGIEKMVLLGHSMGGYVAAAFAERFPQRLCGLGLIDSTPEAKDEIVKDHRLEKARELGVRELMPYAKAMAPKLFKPDQMRTFLQKWKVVAETAEEFHLQGAIHAVEGMAARKDRTRVLEDAQVPVLIVVGTEDRIILPEQSLNKEGSRFTKVSLEGVGHYSMIEAPQRLAEAMLSFLKPIYPNAKEGTRTYESD